MAVRYFFILIFLLSFNFSFGQSVKYDTLSSYLVISKCDSCMAQKVEGYVVAEKSHFVFDNMFNEEIKPKYNAIYFLDKDKIKITNSQVLGYKLND